MANMILSTDAGLKQAINEAYTPSPSVHCVAQVYNIKDWLMPHLHNIHGHTQPLCFKFTRDENNKAIMRYRHWSTDPWSEDKVTLLKVRTKYFVLTYVRTYLTYPHTSILNETEDTVAYTYIRT
jgi:hypothetical protein